MPNQNIFITGGSGRIGHFLIPALLENGYKITLLCERRTEGFQNASIKRVSGDLLDPDSYAASLKGADVMLHMAAVTHTNKISKYYEINSDATLGLIRTCRSSGIKRFIFISTRAISEEGGHYSRSKLAAEKYVQESGLDWVIVRLAEVYGISGKTDLNMILRDIGKLPFVPIVGSGDYRLAPVHISDVVNVITKVMENTGIKNKIYNIAGPESFTYSQLIDKILELKHLEKIKVNIPIHVFKMVTKASALFFGDKYLVSDQLPRLLCEKSEDISLARKDLCFNPARLEDTIGASGKNS